MRVFQSTYVGRHDFPKSLPDFLLQQWFTFNDRDRRAIRKAFRSRHWIGAALQLGFVSMTGTTLRSLDYVPAAVLRHLCHQFKQPVPDIATLRSLYRRRKARFAHLTKAAIDDIITRGTIGTWRKLIQAMNADKTGRIVRRVTDVAQTLGKRDPKARAFAALLRKLLGRPHDSAAE